MSVKRGHILSLIVYSWLTLAVYCQDLYCTSDPGTALYEVAWHCISAIIGENDPADLYTPQYWNKTCSYRDGVYPCMAQEFRDCGTAYIDRMYGEFLRTVNDNSYYFSYASDRVGEICENRQVNEEIVRLYAAGDNARCLSDEEKEAVTACLAVWHDEIEEFLPSVNASITAQEKNGLVRWAIGTYQCALNIARTTCEKAALDILVFIVNQTIPWQIRDQITREQIYKQPSPDELLSYDRSTVGVFGDPHLQIYKVNQLMTCSSPGSQIYIRNKLFMITGTNSFVRSTRATTLTSFEIEFFGSTASSAGMYSAQNGMLPSKFVSGQETVITDTGVTRLSNVTSGSRIKMTNIEAGYILLIRRWRLNYFFTLRMGDAVFDISDGLLVTSCAKKDQLDPQVNRPVRRKRQTLVAQCAEACQNVSAQGSLDFKTTCLYDCEISEDPQIAVMSQTYSEDVVVVEREDTSFPLAAVTESPDTSSAQPLVTWSALSLVVMAALTL